MMSDRKVLGGGVRVAFFDQNIKVTADGNSVTHFVPYVINAQHFSPAAQRILAQTVASITDKKNINAVNGLLLVLGIFSLSRRIRCEVRR
eukprot:1979271-Rhodomonas_salina.2